MCEKPEFELRGKKIGPGGAVFKRVKRARIAAATAFDARARIYACFLARRALMRPATVGMMLTSTMPTMSSSKCSCTNGIPPKK